MADLGRTLRALSRLSLAAADQLDALERADRGRFMQLEPERREAQLELLSCVSPAPTDEGDASAPVPSVASVAPDLAGLAGLVLAEALAGLESPTAVDDAAREQLDQLRATVRGIGVGSRPRGATAGATLGVGRARPGMTAGTAASVPTLDLRR